MAEKVCAECQEVKTSKKVLLKTLSNSFISARLNLNEIRPFISDLQIYEMYKTFEQDILTLEEKYLRTSKLIKEPNCQICCWICCRDKKICIQHAFENSNQLQ